MVQIYPVLICNSAQAGLWPMARAACPDIFAPLFQGHSVFQTAALAMRGPQMARPLVVVAMAHRFLALGQLAAVGLEAADILALPSPPDATTALGVAALHLQATQGTDVGLLAVPLARALPNLGAVAQAVQAAAPDIAQGQIGQFSPSTGAGASADTGLWFGRASALVQALERDCGTQMRAWRAVLAGARRDLAFTCLECRGRGGRFGSAGTGAGRFRCVALAGRCGRFSGQLAGPAPASGCRCAGRRHGGACHRPWVP